MVKRRVSTALVTGSLAFLLAACSPFFSNAPSLVSTQAGNQPVSVPQTGAKPSVTVKDQTYDGVTVVVADVVSQGPGWIAIHKQENGKLGPPIGFAQIQAGDNKNVSVKLDPSQVTPVMYAMLHIDSGIVGKYEFPGPDVPFMLDGQMITPAFKAEIHSETANLTPSVKVQDQVVKDGKVIISEVISPGSGWVAIHVQEPDGKTGPDIGFTAVKAGSNKNVIVTVDQNRITPVMHAMLHVDAGEIGSYEFPGPDEPITLNGQMIAPAFNTGVSATGVAAASQPAATIQPATPAQPTSDMSGMGMETSTPSGVLTPMVKVSNQPGNSGMIMIDQVVSSGAGWIVIYTTNSAGQPDQAIGWSAVRSGDNENVMIHVDPSKGLGRLVAQLHSDQGQAGNFEFPGPDIPVMVGTQMISSLFTVTSSSGSATNAPPTVQATSSTAVPPTATQAQPSATSAPTQAARTPAITVESQAVINGEVKISEVDSVGDAWLVIHKQNPDGTMGGEIGFTKVKNGVSTNVTVKIRTESATPELYAMLHEDHGVINTLEFPGPDAPVMVGGQMLTQVFVITGGIGGVTGVDVSKSGAGALHLVDSNGMTLYVSLRDTPGKSNCTVECEALWKPLTVSGRLAPTGAVSADKLGIILLADGRRQVTYAGAPLYLYSKDAKAGDAKGNGLEGVWFLALP